jgi:hypothetical protein
MGREEKSVLGNNASVIIELKESLCDEMQSCCLELYLRAALCVSYSRITLPLARFRGMFKYLSEKFGFSL